MDEQWIRLIAAIVRQAKRDLDRQCPTLADEHDAASFLAALQIDTLSLRVSPRT